MPSSYNVRVAETRDAVDDRSPIARDVSLFHIAQKYGDVSTTEELVTTLKRMCGL